MPHYEGLETEKILAFAGGYPEVAEALPLLEREINKLPRDYICNLVHTVVKAPFVVWVQRQIDART